MDRDDISIQIGLVVALMLALVVIWIGPMPDGAAPAPTCGVQIDG